MTRSSTFFICGAPKSGTTWLQAIMNAHPVVSCFGEGHFVEQIAMPLEGLLRNYNAKLKLVSERVYQGEEDYKLLATGEIVGLTRILLLNLMRRPGLKPTTQWLGDKTPAYAKHLKALNLIFPDCKVFHIVRDPRDVAVSSLFHAKRAAVITDLESETDTRRTLLQNAIGRWKETVNAVNDARELLGPRLMEVRYETLIDAPRETIPPLFAHLDTLGCDEAVLSAILAGTSFEVMSGGRKPGEESETSFFRSGTYGQYRDHLTAEEAKMVEQALAPEMQRYSLLEPVAA